jgi:hypothetical protein
MRPASRRFMNRDSQCQDGHNDQAAHSFFLHLRRAFRASVTTAHTKAQAIKAASIIFRLAASQ